MVPLCNEQTERVNLCLIDVVEAQIVVINRQGQNQKGSEATQAKGEIQKYKSVCRHEVDNEGQKHRSYTCIA